MPTLSGMIIPIPKSWDEFEDICLSCLKIKWGNPNLTRHGRKGQPQAGVDIYGDDNLSLLAGIQCKLTASELDIKTIKAEIVKAETFQPTLDVFYVATTSSADAKLQREIRLISKERVNDKKFPIGILFWQDLIQELIANEQEFRKHYPQLFIKNHEKNHRNRLLSLIDIAYLGLNLKYYMEMIFGEIGQMVQEDPMQIDTITLNIEACAITLMESEKLHELLEILKKYRKYVIPFILGEEDRAEGWMPANNMATSIEARIERIEYSLTGKELAVFNIGRILGKWNCMETSNIKIDKAGEEKLLLFINEISPNSNTPNEVLKLIENYRKSDSISTANAPHQMYNLVCSLILKQEIVYSSKL